LNQEPAIAGMGCAAQNRGSGIGCRDQVDARSCFPTLESRFLRPGSCIPGPAPWLPLPLGKLEFNPVQSPNLRKFEPHMPPVWRLFAFSTGPNIRKNRNSRGTTPCKGEICGKSGIGIHESGFGLARTVLVRLIHQGSNPALRGGVDAPICHWAALAQDSERSKKRTRFLHHGWRGKSQKGGFYTTKPGANRRDLVAHWLVFSCGLVGV
jgi:hypothetical protein